MAKIVNTKTGDVIYSDETSNCYGVIADFIEAHDITITTYECLSDIIKTMNGDTITPFNTIAELIENIPEILTATEESTIVQINKDKIYFFVLPYEYEYDATVWNGILQTVFPEYSVIDE